MDDVQTRLLFKKVIAWTTPRVDKEARLLGLSLGPFNYEFVDLNHGQHSQRPDHLLKCAKVSFSRFDQGGKPGNIVEVDLAAIERKAVSLGIPVPNFMVKLGSHETAHVAHNQHKYMSRARARLDNAFKESRAELIDLLDSVGEDDATLPPKLVMRQETLLLRTHQLHSAVQGLPYLREGFAVDIEGRASEDGTRPANDGPRYVDGATMMSIIRGDARLGVPVFQALMETTEATAEDMFTPYEAEFDADRWSRRIRRVGYPMALPNHTFDQRFAEKYAINPGETIGRLLDAHARTATALAITQAGDGDLLPKPLAHLVWDIGHVAAEVDGTNPREVLHNAKQVFHIGDADERIEAFKEFVEAGATVAAARAQSAHAAGDPMPVTVGNLAKSVSRLMEVERNPRPTLRRAAVRAMFGR